VTPLGLMAAPLSLLLALRPDVSLAASPTTPDFPALSAVAALQAQAASASAPNRIDGLTIEEQDDGTTTLRLVGSAKPTFSVYRLQDPDRLVVDIAGSERGKVVPHLPLDNWACGRLSVDDVTEQDAMMVRLVVELKRDASYIVVPDGENLVVTVTPRQVPPEAYFARKSASSRRAEIEAAEQAAARKLADAKDAQRSAKHHSAAAAREIAGAQQRLADAQEAESRARTAEKRALAAQARARSGVDARQGHRLASRRALRRAEAELAAAEKARKHAQSQAKLADAALAKARAEADADRAAAGDARRSAEAMKVAASRKLEDAEVTAQQRLAAATERATEVQTEAERRASAVQTDAERAAAKKLAAAKAQASLTESAAQRKLADAERAKADADRSEAAAREKLAAAQQAAAAAQRDAEALRAKAGAADAKADAKLADAQGKLGAAEDKLAAAQRELDAAAVQAKAARTKLEGAQKAAEAKLAEAEQTRAEADRILASAKLEAKAKLAAAQKTADETVAAAQRRADAQASAKLDAAARDAEALVAGARRKADAAVEARMREAEAAARDKIADAERKARSIAQKELAAAEHEAERKLADAKKESKRRADAEVAAARKQAVADAERELAALRKRAEQETATQVAAARKQAEAEAARDLAAARERATAEADKQVSGAKQRATALERQAADKLAAADQTLAAAKRERQSAASAKAEAVALREQAESALAKARAAMDDAATEKKAAIAARKDADRDLVAAKSEASRARKRGELTEQMQARVEAAERARDSALARQKQAEQDLAKLSGDREQLASKLAAERKSSEKLAQAVDDRERELVAARKQVEDARGKLADLGGRATPEEFARAQAETRKVQATATVLEKQVGRLRSDADEAKARASAAERKLQELEAQGARRKKLEAARDEAEAAQKAAKAAKAEHHDADVRLAALNKDLAARKSELEQLTAARAELESQGEALRAKNAAAKQALEQAEQKLATLENKLAGERSRLGAVEDEIRRAQSRLETRVEQVTAQRSAPEAQPKSAAKDAAPTEPTLAEATPPKPPKPRGAATKVRDVRFEDDRDESRVIIAFDGPISYTGNTLTPTIQVLQLDGARMPGALERSLDATAYDGPIKLVTSFVEGEDAKVVVSTAKASKPRLEERPGELVWHFPRVGKGKPSEAVSIAGTKVGGYASAPPAAAMAPVGASDDGVIMDSRPTRSRGRWRGERIDIELQDAPIKDVLLLFSDIGRVNIIAGRNVEGSVTMKLNSVPWDQALDIILRSLNLGSSRDGNVIRVATVEDLENERRAAIERAAARVQQKPLETKLLPVSYATVDEMVPKVQSVLSSRGSVTPDTRTNTLIIMDVSENIALAESLVQQLDTQTPQVLIEARIVEARTSFARQLGVQWGFDFIASPGTGNPTGLLFPNSVGVGGGATGQPADRRGLILPGAAASPNYAVDLPVPVGTGTGGAIGFSFGSISGNLNTNLRLSASESTGEIRIISAPKIVTLDNSEAQIEQGVQIPISQVSAQGVNTRFVRATLGLTVTPHVTNEGAILLDVVVEKNEADFVNTGARGDPTILTKQAQSRMLINDNDTAVIGGIYTRSKAVNYDKIPWIADVPIIGWFFKQKSEADVRSEVLIFLTPKIVNRASSIGG
jgi:type IV pilus assembly protein PilQ